MLGNACVKTADGSGTNKGARPRGAMAIEVVDGRSGSGRDHHHVVSTNGHPDAYENGEIYGIEKVADELTSQAHAKAIKSQRHRILKGMEIEKRGYRECKAIMCRVITL